MYISFNNKALRKVCEENLVAEASYGKRIAEQLHNRLADLTVVKSVFELPVGRPKQLEGEKYKVDLCDGHRLVFGSSSPKVLLDENGLIDWSKVDRIKILEIIRYE